MNETSMILSVQCAIFGALVLKQYRTVLCSFPDVIQQPMPIPMPMDSYAYGTELLYGTSRFPQHQR